MRNETGIQPWGYAADLAAFFMKRKRSGILGSCGWIFLTLFVLSLIPVFAVGTYDRMFSDDYDYSVQTRSAWTQSYDLGDVLEATVSTVEETYATWQGTYSAAFLFSLQPAVFSQSGYALTPFLLIAALIAGIGALSYSVCTWVLKQDRRVWLLSWMFASMLCVQFPRDASEGFFWYNAGVYYTLFFGLLLLWLGIALELMARENLGRRGIFWKSTALILLSGLIAGGNYSTALLLGIFVGCFLLWSALRKKRMLVPFMLALAVYAAGFSLSVAAPGNAVRQSLLQQQTPINAILHAITGAPIRLIGQLLRHPGILALLLLVWAPLCVVFVRNASQRFRLPLLPIIGSFLLLAAMFTPSYYAMSNAGPYRLWNIIFFSFYLILMANLYYLAGWGKNRFSNAYQKLLAFLTRIKRFAPAYLFIMVCASVMLSGVGPSLGIERESPTSVLAAEALENGSARDYALAFDRQVTQIAASTQETVVLDPIPAPDSILSDGDLTRYLAISNEPSRWFDRALGISAVPDTQTGD